MARWLGDVRYGVGGNTTNLTKLLRKVKEITFVECLLCGRCLINVAPFSPSQIFIDEEIEPQSFPFGQDTELDFRCPEL